MARSHRRTMLETLSGALLASSMIVFAAPALAKSSATQHFAPSMCEKTSFGTPNEYSKDNMLVCRATSGDIIAWNISDNGRRHVENMTADFDSSTGLKKLSLNTPDGQVIMTGSYDKAANTNTLNWAVTLKAGSKITAQALKDQAIAVGRQIRLVAESQLPIHLFTNYVKGKLTTLHAPAPQNISAAPTAQVITLPAAVLVQPHTGASAATVVLSDNTKTAAQHTVTKVGSHLWEQTSAPHSTAPAAPATVTIGVAPTLPEVVVTRAVGPVIVTQDATADMTWLGLPLTYNNPQDQSQFKVFSSAPSDSNTEKYMPYALILAALAAGLALGANKDKGLRAAKRLAKGAQTLGHGASKLFQKAAASLTNTIGNAKKAFNAAPGREPSRLFTDPARAKFTAAPGYMKAQMDGILKDSENAGLFIGLAKPSHIDATDLYNEFVAVYNNINPQNWAQFCGKHGPLLATHGQDEVTQRLGKLLEKSILSNYASVMRRTPARTSFQAVPA